MRALEVRGPGRVEIVERADPSPGVGQIVMRMKASTLNFRDMASIRGMGREREPFVPLSDGAGVVESVGPGVTRWKEGDRVTTLFFGPHWQAGRPDGSLRRLAIVTGGCGQELQAVDQFGVVATPEDMSDEESAALTCAGVTAWRALAVEASVRAGDVALFQGTGGVSVFGLQIARAMGLETIITSSSDEKLARARSLGADHVINYRTSPDWGSVVRELTGGRGVDVILEVGGPATLPQSIGCLAIDGDLCVIGGVAGGGRGTSDAVFSLFELAATSRRLHGSIVGSREDHENLMRLCSLHRIKPVIDMTFAWTDIATALEAQEAGRHFSKIALTF